MFTETSGAWYYLAGVDVLGSSARGDAGAAFGDSITNGAGYRVMVATVAEVLRGR